jgi:shikimate kinase
VTRADALSLALVGMPGCGKSTVGRHLARQLGLRFADSDSEIEHRIGMPIREFFAAHGEAAFRDIEAEVIAQLAGQGGIVLATGGGAVLRPSNRDALHSHMHVFYLRATPEDLHRRLRNDTHRPLLQVADPLRKLRELYRERDPLYRRTAHFVVESVRPSVPGLTGMVLMQLELAGLVDPAQVPAQIGATPATPSADDALQAARAPAGSKAGPPPGMPANGTAASKSPAT